VHLLRVDHKSGSYMLPLDPPDPAYLVWVRALLLASWSDLQFNPLPFDRAEYVTLEFPFKESIVIRDLDGIEIPYQVCFFFFNIRASKDVVAFVVVPFFSKLCRTSSAGKLNNATWSFMFVCLLWDLPFIPWPRDPLPRTTPKKEPKEPGEH
jgi:hypothetical protein